MPVELAIRLAARRLKIKYSKLPLGSRDPFPLARLVQLRSGNRDHRKGMTDVHEKVENSIRLGRMAGSPLVDQGFPRPWLR